MGQEALLKPGAGAPAIQETMTIVGHLGELRRRLIISLFALAAGTMLGWFQSGRVIHFLAAKVGQFVFFHPTEAFFSYLDVSLAVGAIAASPVILGEVWLFVVPGLLPSEARFFRRWVPLVIALFAGGTAFGYFAVYPLALQFFFQMGSGLTAMLAIQRYLGFLWTWIFPFGLMFELPLVLVVLAKLGIVTAGRLRAKRKYFLFGAFVLAIFICPSEIVLQFLIAIPLAVLYELSIPLVARTKPASLYDGAGESGEKEQASGDE